ncbi:hypothetical protein CA51_07950 [Rosistilla oblonga]|uniref:hypothetical protein n=1 Tax=Rosistilla oblonga TaxID=2527990 RepID=UPI0011887B7C|nr:hypothetical protein [Rosistilla oblonga]QDV10936.1 hypothetical protein CA51_07950 [Rosistilla oblonga]
MNGIDDSGWDHPADHRPRIRTGSRIMWCHWFVVGVLLLTSSLSGCASFQGVFSSCDCSINESLHLTRARMMARRVWSKEYASCYSQHCNTLAVRRGFIDGFVDVASGKDGCPPVFPPRNTNCLTGAFRSPDSACRDQAWFEGYPQGAAAAEQQGCHLWWRASVPAHLMAQYHHVDHLASTAACCGATEMAAEPGQSEATAVLPAELVPEPQSQPASKRRAHNSVLESYSIEAASHETVSEVMPMLVREVQPPKHPTVSTPSVQQATSRKASSTTFRAAQPPVSRQNADRVAVYPVVVAVPPAMSAASAMPAASAAPTTAQRTSIQYHRNDGAQDSEGMILTRTLEESPLSQVIRTSARWSEAANTSK